MAGVVRVPPKKPGQKKQSAAPALSAEASSDSVSSTSTTRSMITPGGLVMLLLLLSRAFRGRVVVAAAAANERRKRRPFRSLAARDAYRGARVLDARCLSVRRWARDHAWGSCARRGDSRAGSGNLLLWFSPPPFSLLPSDARANKRNEVEGVELFVST